MKSNCRKLFYCLSLLICLSIFTSSLILQITYHKFSSDEVKNNIALLTSDQFEGRLTGSEGCAKASNFIESSFKSSNLIPYGKSYKESFNVLTPVLNNTEPQLVIKNNGKIVKSYIYGSDYKEDMTNFRTSTACFSDSDDVYASLNSIIINKNNHKYLFHLNSANNFNFRSSLNCDSKYDFCIDISNSLYNDILNAFRKGYTLTITIPYNLDSKPSYNVIGYIKGTSPSLPPLILSAHYDHLGKDHLGNSYNGALDNASGTSFLIELSKTVSSFVKPKRTIIFAAFSGEEFGLLGSKNFVDNHFAEIRNADVLNFDMIGAPNTDLSFMIGNMPLSNCKSSTLLHGLENICENKSINYLIDFRNSSDHASFASLGINAVTVCNSDTSRIHTPNDTIDYIDDKSINTAYSVVYAEILNLAYNKYSLIMYKPIIPIASCICFILIVLLSYINSIKKDNKKTS